MPVYVGQISYNVVRFFAVEAEDIDEAYGKLLDYLDESNDDGVVPYFDNSWSYEGTEIDPIPVEGLKFPETVDKREAIRILQKDASVVIRGPKGYYKWQPSQQRFEVWPDPDSIDWFPISDIPEGVYYLIKQSNSLTETEKESL